MLQPVNKQYEFNGAPTLVDDGEFVCLAGLFAGIDAVGQHGDALLVAVGQFRTFCQVVFSKDKHEQT